MNWDDLVYEIRSDKIFQESMRKADNDKSWVNLSNFVEIDIPRFFEHIIHCNDCLKEIEKIKKVVDDILWQHKTVDTMGSHG